MINLTINENEPTHVAILEKLISKTMSHKVEFFSTDDTPVMEVSGRVYVGSEGVLQGIEELEDLFGSLDQCRQDS